MTEFFEEAAADVEGAIEGVAKVEENPSEVFGVIEHPIDAIESIHPDGDPTVD